MPNRQQFEATTQQLADKLITFVRAHTLGEKKAYLAQHPELLTDEASSVMEMLIQAQDNQDAIRFNLLFEEK